MGAILYGYIKVKGSKIFQDDPHIPIKLYYINKTQDNIGWDNMMWVRISNKWNKWQSDYLKEGVSRKTGIKCASSFIENP